jgi:transcriptional regulator with XRE-family HTH domain
MNDKSIGERVLQFRRHLGLSQKEVSEAINMSRSNISKIEKNLLEPSNAFLATLKEQFAANPDWIITGKGEMFISPQEYIINGVKLLGPQRFSEGLTSILRDPSFSEFYSQIRLDEMVRKNLDQDQDLIAYLQHIVNLWRQGDERTRIWLIVQLERAFPEVGEKIRKGRKNNDSN